MTGVNERVVIAGAGPVGLTAALALTRRGIAVTVLEAEESLPTTPRASTFHPPTLEILDDLGVGQTFLSRGYRVDRFQFREYAGGVVANFDLAAIADRTRFPFRLQCPQDWLARILLDELEKSDLAEVTFGAPVVAVEQDGDGARAIVEGPEGRRTVEGAYVIGADGARSAVRRGLGIEFTGISYPVRQVQMMTTLDLRRYLPDLCEVAYVLDPDEWFILLHTPPGVWRALVPLPQSAADDDAHGEAWMQEKLRRFLGDPAAPVDIVYRAVYTAHQRVAERFRAGRIFIAGDAAHVNTPFGGMGINCGIHDAAFLATALEGVMAGGTDDALDRWADARRRVAVEYVQNDTAKTMRDVELRDGAEREKRNREMRRIASDPQTAREYLMRSSMIRSVDETRLQTR